MSAMGMGMTGNPECQSVYLATVDDNDGEIHQDHQQAYLLQSDIDNISPCEFWEDGNPEPQHSQAHNPELGCEESFTNYSDSVQLQKSNNFRSNTQEIVSSQMPDDVLIKIFYSVLGLSGLFILWKILFKSKCTA